MNVERNGRLITVTLSRRNLETLLLKLDEPDSQRTLVRHCGEYSLVVMAEENEEHYNGRTPGPVHPREDARLT